MQVQRCRAAAPGRGASTARAPSIRSAAMSSAALAASPVHVGFRVEPYPACPIVRFANFVFPAREGGGEHSLIIPCYSLFRKRNGSTTRTRKPRSTGICEELLATVG